MIRLLLLAFGTLLTAATLPGTLELLALTLAGVLPPRKSPRKTSARKYRLMVVVPAHNEALHIARCVSSLLSANRSSIDLGIVVVADNCDDQTALIAHDAGAEVLVRNNLLQRGKGCALDFAFGELATGAWEAFAVVDADTEVAPNFLVEITAALLDGAAAVQCRYVVANAHDSIRTRLMRVANAAFNVLRPRGRDRCGLSSGIYGNGFALSARLLQMVPYTANSLVEDLEYHLALMDAGESVRFVDTTSVYGEMPVAGAGVSTQRTRWEGGRFRMLREKTPRLFGKIARGGFRFLEPCLDLLLLPLAFHVSLLLLAALTPSLPVKLIAGFGILVVVIHLAAAIAVTGGGMQDVKALLAAPFYIVWKLLLIPKLASSSRSKTVWTRTERAPQRNLP